MSAEIPEGWEESRVEKVVEILDSKRVPLNSEQRVVRKGQIPYWGANGVVDYIDDYIFDEPLILMAEDGGYFSEARYRPICHRLDGRAWVNNHAHVMRPLTVERDWFYYWFVHRDITPHIKGGTRTKLNQKDLRQLPILLPPLPEQRRIAEILSSVDDAIAATQAVIDQTRTVKQGVLKRLLTKGIGHTRFKQTEIGEIPEEWEVKTLGEVASVKGGKRMPKGRPFAGFPTPHPYLRVCDFQAGSISRDKLEYVLPEDQKLISRYIIETGNVYISIAGSIGICGTVPPDLSGAQLTENAAKICIHDPATLSYLYLSEFLSSEVGQGQIARLIGVGGGVPKLALFRIEGLHVPVPPKKEQDAIVNVLRQIDNATQTNLAAHAQFQTLKSALMSDLLTGRKRVSVPEENVAAAE